ncbi:unnamed protein product [Tuber melanosporum]|uniref:(Perigord truffle) hypothetical protein n=1 Tax=Tuber melanosporum (strain Mel28) TaxID=656061 RepID=D5GD84_TUBMM|nr:uncharacterized protein GSTUM_00006089001 [Tuber melanosporum]CAZ82477.1 unnamed protein product [Tuber melanosporum]
MEWNGMPYHTGVCIIGTCGYEEYHTERYCAVRVLGAGQWGNGATPSQRISIQKTNDQASPRCHSLPLVFSPSLS